MTQREYQINNLHGLCTTYGLMFDINTVLTTEGLLDQVYVRNGDRVGIDFWTSDWVSFDVVEDCEVTDKDLGLLAVFALMEDAGTIGGER